MKRSFLTREIIELVMTGLLLLAVIQFVWHGYHMQGANMKPTIAPDAYVMVNKASYLFGAPARGDIVVFHYPFDTNEDMMARVIGIPGDTIRTDGTRVWVNGRPLQELYISQPSNPAARDWTVPHNSYFVLNDNRPATDDSRSWDSLPRDFIIGKAVLVYWPLDSWHVI